MADTETTLEYARQKLAYDLWLRHVAITATRAAGSVPMLHDLAGKKNRTAFLKYMYEVVEEFTGKMLTVTTKSSTDELNAYARQQKIRARIERSLELIVFLAFAGVTMAAFDTERGQWRIPSRMLIVPDYIPSPDLAKVEHIYLEANTKDEYFFITRPKFPPVAVAPSLAFVKKAMDAIIDRAHNPTSPTVEDVGRKPRQTTAAAAATATPAATSASNATPAAATSDADIDDDKPVNVTDRTHACTQLANALVTAHKWLESAHTRGFKREDIGNAAFNAMGDIARRYHTMVDIEETNKRKAA